MMLWAVLGLLFSTLAMASWMCYVTERALFMPVPPKERAFSAFWLAMGALGVAVNSLTIIRLLTI